MQSTSADPYQSFATSLTNQYLLSMWSLKDDEYQTSYDDEPLDEHGVQQGEAPEEEEDVVGGEEQQEEEEEDTAEGSQVFDTEEVWKESAVKTQHRWCR